MPEPLSNYMDVSLIFILLNIYVSPLVSRGRYIVGERVISDLKGH